MFGGGKQRHGEGHSKDREIPVEIPYDLVIFLVNSVPCGLFNSVSPLWGNSQVKGSPKNRSGTGGTSRPGGGSNEARPGTSGPPVTSCLAVPGAYVLSVEVFGARSCL